MAAVCLVSFAIVPRSGSTGGDAVQLELWQWINLIGTPILMLMFMSAAVGDIAKWVRSRRQGPQRPESSD